MRNRLLIIFLLLILVAVSFWAGIKYSSTGNKANHSPQNSLSVVSKVPAYTLTNQLGQKVSSKEFNGKVRVVSFLFPYCKEYCPLIAINMVSLEQVLKSAHLANRVQLISYDVDPGHTGPSQMRAFMKEYGWNPQNMHWQYLTGKPSEIRRIVRKSYYISYQIVSEATEDSLVNREKQKGTYVPSPEVRNKLADKVKPDYDVSHNDALAIVDTKGQIRKIYDDADHVSNQQILHTIEQLIPHN